MPPMFDAHMFVGADVLAQMNWSQFGYMWHVCLITVPWCGVQVQNTSHRELGG